MLQKLLLLFFLVFLSIEPIYSWSNHGLGTWLSLYSIRSFSQSPFVKVESLEEFLEKEKDGLSAYMRETEDEIHNRISSPYRQLPSEWEFSGKSPDLVSEFFRSIRLNPDTRLGYYIQEMPGIPQTKPIHPHSEITTYKDYSFLKKDIFRKVKLGSIQSPLYVLVTAVDEPDYGMDVGLFEDNGTDFGKLYGFGEQPFGDPKYEYSSQAPFHMGFYYESSWIYTFAPFLSKTYPEVRIYQFLRLSQFAFQTGHEYWGYRFLGWGLHYIQNLTQPYHTRVLPQYSPGKMIRVNLAAMIGFSGGKEEAINRVSTRHTFIEKYQYEWIRSKMKSRVNPDDPIYQAFRKKESNEIIEDIFSYPRSVVAYESFQLADGFDASIENFATSFMDTEWKLSKLPENNERQEMEAYLLEMAENFGYHTRRVLEWARGKKL